LRPRAPAGTEAVTRGHPPSAASIRPPSAASPASASPAYTVRVVRVVEWRSTRATSVGGTPAANSSPAQLCRSE
jgi:hypothetical protein